MTDRQGKVERRRFRCRSPCREVEGGTSWGRGGGFLGVAFKARCLGPWPWSICWDPTGRGKGGRRLKFGGRQGRERQGGLLVAVGFWIWRPFVAHTSAGGAVVLSSCQRLGWEP